LEILFPYWKVKAETGYGSPAREIVTTANRMRADLIVVGSHGRSAFGRFVLGSVSQKVLAEALCSVRVGRGRVEVDPLPSRVIIAYDGTPGADAMLDAVIARNWREGSEFRLITVADRLVPAEIERFMPLRSHSLEDEIKGGRGWVEQMALPALKRLRGAGLSASLDILAGSPKQILVEEAASWHADSIFLGATACTARTRRFILGSVPAAVAARAHCSVEVVRKQM
jgi:nucleotide-binding universal stress UspA family protein